MSRLFDLLLLVLGVEGCLAETARQNKPPAPHGVLPTKTSPDTSRRALSVFLSHQRVFTAHRACLPVPLLRERRNNESTCQTYLLKVRKFTREFIHHAAGPGEPGRRASLRSGEFYYTRTDTVYGRLLTL
uniref:Uncharacterized protein n=1 Tax=Branchiostoma floridae TaxID=7739 RepID=C3YSS0_BRAFL|eukprot:XP_002600759.1 hypothetical protein BRAFLDRAFT_83502 [Branchiostoma floridae]